MFQSQFPIGAKVRIKPEAKASYQADFFAKVSGRTGEVTGYSFPYGWPRVSIPKDGRRAAVAVGQIIPKDWEVIG